MIHVFNHDPTVGQYINTTSRSRNWSRGLSPFTLGPVKLYGGYTALNVENAWQFCKVYNFGFNQHVDKNNNPTRDYWQWAFAGWADPVAQRYPMGKGARPLYSWWDGEKLDYIEARKRIYCPLYAKAVSLTPAYWRLQQEYDRKGELWLWDFDAYDHRALGMTYADVLNNPAKKMGHAFVLAMMLEHQREWEES